MSKNPNAVGGNETPNEAETGWESVAAEAGKMKAPEPGSYAEFEQQDHESRDFIAAKEQELANLRAQLKKIAKTPNFPGVGGGVSSAELKEKERALQEELENARWERQERKNSRRDMAEIISAQLYGENAKTGQLAEQEDESSEDAIATPQPSRKLGLFGRLGNRSAKGEQANNEKEMSFSEAYDAYEKQVLKEQRHGDPKRNEDIAYHDVIRARWALQHKESAEKRYSNGKSKKERDQAFSDVKEAIRELHRYGYNENSNDSSEFELLKSGRQTSKDLEIYGNSREVDYKLLQFCLTKDGKVDKDVKKALKKAGFNKLPEKMDDKNFTAYEIRHMKDIAESRRRFEEGQKH